VAVHTMTQQSDAHHGGHVCGIDLAVSPKTEAFRGIDNQLAQRVTCVVYIHWLNEPQPRQVYIPKRHQQIVAAIYENMKSKVEFGNLAEPAEAHGTHTVKFSSGAALATISAETLGRDSVCAIRRAARELIERSRAEVIAVELPIHDPAAAAICEALEIDGLGFTGIGPHFSPRGDVLRLTYLVEPLARDPIKTFEPFAARLVDYALAEQERVRKNL